MTYYEEKHKASQMKYRLASAGVVNDLLLFVNKLKSADADARPEVLRSVLNELLPELEYLKELQDDVDCSIRWIAEEKEKEEVAVADKEDKNESESELC